MSLPSRSRTGPAMLLWEGRPHQHSGLWRASPRTGREPEEGKARLSFLLLNEETKDLRGRAMFKDTGANKQQSQSGTLQPHEQPHTKLSLGAGTTTLVTPCLRITWYRAGIMRPTWQ